MSIDGVDGDRSAAEGRAELGRSVRHLIVLALGLGVMLWLALLIELAQPLRDSVHHDILAFLAAGRLVLDGRPGDLYDPAAVTAIQRTMIPGPVGVNGYMPFINPPFAAALFAPIAMLPAAAARAVWAVINIGVMAGVAAWITAPASGRERWLAMALVGASYPVYHALAEGQWSILLLAAGLAALAAARRGRWTLVGIALVPFMLKAQFLLLPLLGLLLARRWRALAALILGGLVVAGLSLPLTGVGPYVAYVGYLSAVVMSHFSGAGAVAATTWQGNLATTEGLNGLLVGYLGQGAVGLVDLLWALGVVALVGLYGLAVVRQRPGWSTPRARAMLAVGIVLILLTDPNLFAQDCVLLFLALAALSPLPPRLVLPAVVGTVALADLILLDQGAVTVHLFTIGLLAATALVCRQVIARRSATISPAPATS